MILLLMLLAFTIDMRSTIISLKPIKTEIPVIYDWHGMDLRPLCDFASPYRDI